MKMHLNKPTESSALPERLHPIFGIDPVTPRGVNMKYRLALLILSLGLVSTFITTVSSRNRMVYVENRTPQKAGISVTKGDERILATTGQPIERSIGSCVPDDQTAIVNRSILIDYLGDRPSIWQDGWKVYVRTSPCSGRFDWVSVALQNPTGRGGLGYWSTADIILTGTPMRCVREGSRCTKAEAEAEAVVVRGQPKFRDYCCKEYTVWKQQQTGKWTIVVGKFGNPGPGWFFEDGPMCCEEAEEITGLTGACSGSTGKHPAGYIGCYKDTSVFDLDGYLERSASNTPQSCIAKCKARGFAYAAVQYGQSCLCGNSYGKYGAAANCNMKCTGDAGQICGGYSANSVYSTGGSGDTRPPTTEIDLSGNWRASIVESNTGNNFTYDLVLNRASAGKWTGTLTLTSRPNASYGFTAAATLESLGGGNMRITYFAKGRDQVGTGTFTRDAIFFGGSQNSVKFVRR